MTLAVKKLASEASPLVRRVFVVLALIILVSQLSVPSVFALSASQRKVLESGSLYFNVDPNDVCSPSVVPAQSTLTSSTQTATNLDYAGHPILTDGQLQLIKANQPFYESAAQSHNIPWQMLAVIHLREHGLARDNPGNGQGMYQFADKHGGPYPAGPVSDAEFQRQTNLAADVIVAKVPNGKTLTAQNPDANVVKATFFNYNGAAAVYIAQAVALGYDGATQGFEGSPYVMNRADLKRDPTSEPTKSNNTWGQVKVDHGPIAYPANSDYGAFVEYASLAGIASGTCGVGGPVRQRIVTIAEQELALWSPPNPQLVPGTDYFKYSQGRAENWCADFASWVYNQAGVPLSSTSKDGNVPSVDEIQRIGQDNGTYHDAHGYTPQPGDIVVRKNTGSHVNIVISVQGATMRIIGGNQAGGSGGFSTSKVTSYDDTLSNGDITGYVSPQGG